MSGFGQVDRKDDDKQGRKHRHGEIRSPVVVRHKQIINRCHVGVSRGVSDDRRDGRARAIGQNAEDDPQEQRREKMPRVEMRQRKKKGAQQDGLVWPQPAERSLNRAAKKGLLTKTNQGAQQNIANNRPSIEVGWSEWVNGPSPRNGNC